MRYVGYVGYMCPRIWRLMSCAAFWSCLIRRSNWKAAKKQKQKWTKKYNKNTTKQSKSKSIDSQMEDPQLRQAAIDKARVGGLGGVRVWHARGCALITQVILMPRSTVHCALCTVCCVLCAIRRRQRRRQLEQGVNFPTTGERAQSIINAKHAKQNKKIKRCLPQAQVQQGMNFSTPSPAPSVHSPNRLGNNYRAVARAC